MKRGTSDRKSGETQLNYQPPPLLPLSPLKGWRDGSSWVAASWTPRALSETSDLRRGERGEGHSMRKDECLLREIGRRHAGFRSLRDRLIPSVAVVV